MKRSELNPLPEYFDRYILQCDDTELLQAIDTSIEELKNAPVDKWRALGDRVYAPGKWTVKDLLQHLIDTERIFCYRALVYARGERQKVFSYDEDVYAKNAHANRRALHSLIDELMGTHLSAKALFSSFSDEMMQQMIPGFKGSYSVAAAGFILPGHQRWHFKVLEERYYPIL